VRYRVIHHSGADVDNTALQVARYHVDNLHWPGIGYHFLVHWDGSIDYVGDLMTSRANVYGLNPQCIGICLLGNFTKYMPRAPQLLSARLLLTYLTDLTPQAETVGHRDIALPGHETACPGDTWLLWKYELRHDKDQRYNLPLRW